MELFYENGHLTKEGLHAIGEGSLTELESLEAAEHLSFCDECLAKYTALLTEETLLAPELPLQQPVLRSRRRRAQLLFFNRSGTVAAAACLAVVLWAVGNFALPSLSAQNPSGQAVGAAQTTALPLGTRMNQAAGEISQSLNNFFGGLFAAAPQTGADSTAQQRAAENKQREAVFNQSNPEKEFETPAQSEPAANSTPAPNSTAA